MRPSHIQQYEFLHGCVLTALVRIERPSTVSLIETNAKTAWAMYKVNDAFMHIKPSISPRKQKRDESTVWQFTFSSSEIEKIRDYKSYVVLVCGYSDIKAEEHMWRILIKPDELKNLLNLVSPAEQSALTAKYKPNAKKLVIAGNGREILIAPKALLDWEIPGS